MIDDRIMLTLVAFSFMRDLANVNWVGQQLIEMAPAEGFAERRFWDLALS